MNAFYYKKKKMRKIILYLSLITFASCNSSSDNGNGDKDAMVKKSVPDEKASVTSSAAGCTSYYWFKEGTVAEYSIKDAAGNETSHTTSTVTNVRNENGVLLADFTTLTPKGGAITATYKCEGDKIYMDMKSFFSKNFGGLAAKGGMELEIDNAYLSFPSAMKPGDELEGTTIKVIAKKDGNPVMTTTNEIKDRKVESMEKVSTPAGSWDCFKITETSVTSSEMMGKQLPGKETNTVYWFVPGVGVAKTANYSDDGKLLSETELISLTTK